MTSAEIMIAIALAGIALAIGFALGRRAQRKAEPEARAASGSATADDPGAASRPDASSAVSATGAVRSAATRSAPNEGTDRGDGTGASRLANARSWGYQLQHLDVAKAAASPFDMLVIDYSKDGSDEEALTPAEVRRLQAKPDGSRRIVLAYLSIGEAESYRFYWDPSWKKRRPAWLLRENPDWEENYAVCFWEPGWQDLFCGHPQAYLDRIIAQGFDGIYLDKCDVTEDLREHEKKAAASRPDLDGDMVRFVTRLAGYARDKVPGFLVVMQNAEHLLERPEMVRLIDGMGKEELLFGIDASEKPNSREETEWCRERLDRVRQAGKPVFAVEYLNDRGKITKAAEGMRRLGYVLYVSDKSRELDKLHYTTLEA